MHVSSSSPTPPLSTPTTTTRTRTSSPCSSWLLRVLHTSTICFLMLISISINGSMIVAEAASLSEHANHRSLHAGASPKLKKLASKSAALNSNHKHVQDGLAFLSPSHKSRNPTMSPALIPAGHSTLPIYVHPEHQRASIPSVCGSNADLHSVITKDVSWSKTHPLNGTRSL